MGTYLSFQQAAAIMISKAGGDVTVTRFDRGAYDPVTQTGAPSATPHAFRAVILPPGQASRYRVGSLEGRNAVECYFALQGQAITPDKGDVVTVNGQDLTIFWSQTYDPAADGAIFTLAYAERAS